MQLFCFRCYLLIYYWFTTVYHTCTKVRVSGCSVRAHITSLRSTIEPFPYRPLTGCLAWGLSQAVAGLSSPATAWTPDWASLTLTLKICVCLCDCVLYFSCRPDWLRGWLRLCHLITITCFQLAIVVLEIFEACLSKNQVKK